MARGDGADQTQPLDSASEADSSWVLDGRYRMLRRLGTGSTAEVFRARDDVLDREVAVKVFRTRAVDDTDDIADVDDHDEQRRRRELSAQARLSHPNLIALLDGSLDAGTHPYLVLELVDGPNLAARLHDGPLPEAEARLIGAQVADALAYAHAQGMIHRDVKPANILLGRDGPDGTLRARLSDFGTVRLIDGARLTGANVTVGTATYLSPEQARGGEVGPKTDVYSLGLVLIEALTGRRCFPGSMHEALTARLTTSPTIPNTLSEPWPTLLAAMTARDPALRPTAAQVADALHTDPASTTLTTRRVAAPIPLPTGPRPIAAASRDPRGGHELAAVGTTWISRHAWWVIAAMVVAGLAVGAAFAVSGHRGPSALDRGPASSGTQHTSAAAASPARPGPKRKPTASVVNRTFNAPAIVAPPHLRPSRAATSPLHRHRVPAAQPSAAHAPPTSSNAPTPAATSPGTTPTSPSVSSSPTPSPSPPTSDPTSPTPTPSP